MSSTPEPTRPEFRIDRPNRCVWRDRDRLDLPPKAFDVLDYLRANPGRLVSQEEILDQVWPNRYVQPEIVKTYVRTLRRLLGDDVRQPRFIETRPRSGYRFVGALPERSEPASRPGPACPTLLGREAELALLRSALDRAGTGRRAFMVLSGESGIGKSALLDTFTAGTGAPVASAFGAPTPAAPEPLGMLIALMQDVGRVAGVGWCDALATHGQAWSHLLKAGPPPVQQPGWGQRLVREACAVLEHLAGADTLVLALDDVQWADAGTLAFLAMLGRRRYPARLLVLTTYRQVAFQAPCPIRATLDDLVAHGAAEEIALGPIVARDFACLLRTGTETDRAALAAESGGNPMLLHALQTGATAVRTSLDLELDRDGGLLRSTLEAGSVAGPRFCAWAVSSILDLEQSWVEDLLARLEHANQYVKRDGWYSLPDGNRTPIYRFRHPVHRLCLLTSQAPARRAERYRRFGQAIVALWGDDVQDVADDVSSCFRSAGDLPRAISYARMAAERSKAVVAAVDRWSP